LASFLSCGKNLGIDFLRNADDPKDDFNKWMRRDIAFAKSIS